MMEIDDWPIWIFGGEHNRWFDKDTGSGGESSPAISCGSHSSTYREVAEIAAIVATPFYVAVHALAVECTLQAWLVRTSCALLHTVTLLTARVIFTFRIMVALGTAPVCIAHFCVQPVLKLHWTIEVREFADRYRLRHFPALRACRQGALAVGSLHW